MGYFSAQEQRSDRHVVIPDIHGEHEALERAIDNYIDSDDIDFVFLGDILDRDGVIRDREKGVLKTLDSIKSLGERAIVLTGNHEWRFLAAIYAANPRHRKYLVSQWLGKNEKDGVERNVLHSYGVDRRSAKNKNIMTDLTWRMSQVGHLAILANVAPYYETDSFIAVHAGLDPESLWENQREQLDETARQMSEGVFYYQPPQWFSMGLATNIEKIHHTDKVVLSGHAHDLGTIGRRELPQPCSPERSLHGGTKIRLASRLNSPYAEPLYIWQDWDGQIAEIPTGMSAYQAAAD